MYSMRGQPMPEKEKDATNEAEKSPVLTKEDEADGEMKQSLKEFMQATRDVWTELRKKRSEKKETVEDVRESLHDLKEAVQEISEAASVKRQQESIPKIQEALHELKDELTGVSRKQNVNPEEIEELKENIRELRAVIHDIVAEAGQRKQMLEVKEAFIELRAAVDDISPDVKVAAQRVRQVRSCRNMMFSLIASYAEADGGGKEAQQGHMAWRASSRQCTLF